MAGSRKIKKEVQEVEEEFDKIYFEYMRIMRKRDFKARILDVHAGQLFESVHPTDSRILLVKVKCVAPGEAARMMKAINDMFYEINRSLHSRSIKLFYDGDKDKLAKAFIDDLRDESLGFIARLGTEEDIKIIGNIANMDRDIHTVECFIDDFKQKHPAPSAPKLRATDIALPNGTIVTVMAGDLTKMKCDAIVSSSGRNLSHIRGVSRAIAQACGQRFAAKGRQFIDTGGVLHEGDTFIQPADGRLAVNGVRCVIHAIAPTPQGHREPTALLIKTVYSAIKEAEFLKFRTVALPAICAGNMHVPIATCADCYWAALTTFTSENPRPFLKHIYFVVDDAVSVSQIHKQMSSLAAQGITHAHHRPTGSQPTPSSSHNLGPEQHDEFRQSNRSARGGGAMENVAVRGGHQATTKTNHSDAGGLFDNVAQKLSEFVPFGPTLFGTSHATSATPSTGNHLDPAGNHGGASSAAGASGTPAATGTTKCNDNECPICMEDIKNPIALACCHKFCKECIDEMVKTSKSNLCPTCRTPFRKAEGQQPKGGRMTTDRSNQPRLPGYDRYGTIIITYSMPSGTQGPEHPNPGQPYHGTSRTAYLPDNPQGEKVEKLLRKAFNQRLTFTIGQSVTTGQDNCIVWNDIHHKTNVQGGPSHYGYPDPQYMDRLIEDLKAKGITE